MARMGSGVSGDVEIKALRAAQRANKAPSGPHAAELHQKAAQAFRLAGNVKRAEHHEHEAFMHAQNERRSVPYDKAARQASKAATSAVQGRGSHEDAITAHLAAAEVAPTETLRNHHQDRAEEHIQHLKGGNARIAAAEQRSLKARTPTADPRALAMNEARKAVSTARQASQRASTSGSFQDHADAAAAHSHAAGMAAAIGEDAAYARHAASARAHDAAAQEAKRAAIQNLAGRVAPRNGVPSVEQIVDFMRHDATDRDHGMFSRTTTNEVASHFGISQAKAREALHAAKDAGHVSAEGRMRGGRGAQGHAGHGFESWEHSSPLVGARPAGQAPLSTAARTYTEANYLHTAGVGGVKAAVARDEPVVLGKSGGVTLVSHATHLTGSQAEHDARTSQTAARSSSNPNLAAYHAAKAEAMGMSDQTEHGKRSPTSMHQKAARAHMEAAKAAQAAGLHAEAQHHTDVATAHRTRLHHASLAHLRGPTPAPAKEAPRQHVAERPSAHAKQPITHTLQRGKKGGAYYLDERGHKVYPGRKGK